MHGEDRGTEQTLLATLEQLLAIEATEVKGALDQASQLVVRALHADKVDAFLYDPGNSSLVAVGTSDTPMGRRQHQIGMDRLPLANGGRTVEVFQAGEPYHTGQADEDPTMLVGVTEGLGVRSVLAVPLDVAGERQGVLEVVSAAPDAFAPADLHFLGIVAHWVGMVAHRAQLVEQIAQETAAQARRVAAEELIDVVAHDLRVPLTPLRGYIELVRGRAERAGSHADVRYLNEAGRAVQRVDSMIGELMDTARLEQGLFDLQAQPVNLADLVRESAALLRTPEQDIRVVAPDEMVALADPDRLRQALDNLLSNALAHSPQGAAVMLELNVEAREDGEWAALAVRDQGPGIPTDLLPTLFTRFARGPRSTGLGLGLYLARGIAEAHGGFLTVETAVGKGTTFWLALPVNLAEGRP